MKSIGQKYLYAIALASVCSAATAQSISSISFDPPSPKAGETVKITIDAEKADNANCGLRVDFGDNNDTKEKMADDKPFPLVLMHTYANAGTYEVRAEGKIVRGKLGCNGRIKEHLTVVEAPKPKPAPKKVEPKKAPANKKSSAKKASSS